MEHQHTPNTTAPAGVDPLAVERGYEPHDVKLRGIFVFVAVLAATLVVVLSVIYGIMMALAAYDRSKDPFASPVAVKLPPVYAPLQPSLGFYGDDKNNHLTLDSQDMVVMREKAQADLNAPAGVSATGRGHMPIDSAIDSAMPLLITRAEIPSAQLQQYPAGSYEGHLGGIPLPEKKPGIWSNDMNSLNNQGN